MIETQFDKEIKILCSDNGGEYIYFAFGSYLNQHLIIHQTMRLDTPKQNGVAERKNRHLMEIARALMFKMNVPKTFWASVVKTAIFLMNRLPTLVLDYKCPIEVESPISILFPIPPKVFGCIYIVYINKSNGSKLNPKALKCIFLVYSPTHKGYKCYHPPTRSRKRLVSMDVTFHETIIFFTIGKSPLKGEYCVDDDETSTALPVPSFFFDQGVQTKSTDY